METNLPPLPPEPVESPEAAEPKRFLSRRAASLYLTQHYFPVAESWLGESGQNDKWIFCLTVASIAAHQER
jgi:hypothetical protein